jgi:hypothetical protein
MRYRWFWSCCLPSICKERNANPSYSSVSTRLTLISRSALSIYSFHTSFFPSFDSSLFRFRFPRSVPGYLIHPAYTPHHQHEQYARSGYARTNRLQTIDSRDHNRPRYPYPHFSWRDSRYSPVPAGQSRKASTFGYRGRRRDAGHPKPSFRYRLCQKYSKASQGINQSCAINN